MFTRDSSSDESNMSDSSVNSESSFRISVCLRRYFTDVRARAYMLASRHRRVRWLQRRIRKVFRVRGAFCLRAAGHLLPPGEPLRLLAPDDCVEVIPIQETETEHTKKNQQHAIDQIKGRSCTEEITVTCLSTFAADRVHSHRSKQIPPEPLAKDITDGITESPAAAAATDSSSDRLDSGGGDQSRLRALKQRALDLLDARCDQPEPPAASPRPASPRAASARGASPRDVSPSAASGRAGSPPRRRRVRRRVRRAAAVARNEDACARKPRVVHSLDAQHMST